MNHLMRMLFGGRAPAQPVQRAAPTSRAMPLSQDDSSENATRTQLVQVLLRDVLRRHGIPFNWVESQMLVVASRSRGSGMYVRLIMKHWDDRLITHAFALQNTLLADIARFEPRAFDWLHGVSWQLDVDGSCPHTFLPHKTYWQEPAIPATPGAAAAPAPVVTPPTPAAPAAPAAPDGRIRVGAGGTAGSGTPVHDPRPGDRPPGGRWKTAHGLRKHQANAALNR
ncbi:hypothetical protein LP415_20735 [Polaromonas sp. P1(28)-8]|nr:hypothetical protein LP415_20735 [Polaromonas sp. P1(28)-8]